MRRDTFEEFDLKQTKKAVEETPSPDSSYSEGALNQFFNLPIWQDIDKVLRLRQGILMATMLDEGTSREEDLKRKGQYVEVSFMRNIRQVFESEQEEGEEDE